MKNAFFTALLLVYSVVLIAQPVSYFEKTLSQNMVVNDAYKIIKLDSTYLIAGRGISNTQQQNSFLVEMTEFGDTTNTHLYQYDNKNVILLDVQKTNNGYAITGEATDSITNYERVYLFLLLTNLSGDVILFKDLGITNYSTGKCIWADADGSFVIGGTAYINEHKELYCLKVSADGTILWQYIDTTYTRTNYFTDILPDGTGGYYLYGSVNQYAYGLVATGDLLLLHLNANGQMIDQHTYSIGETDYSLDMIRTNDNNIVLGMAYGGDDSFIRGRAIKINLNTHQIMWQSPNLYLDEAVAALIELPDGNIITAGSTRPPIVNSFGQMSLVKIAADGTPMWSRQYGGQWNDYGYDLALSPDGGFVAVGRKDSAVVQTAFLYIVKTNCMGLLTLPQANFAAQMDTAALRITLQNLSQFVYPDSIDGGHYLWDFGDGATSTQINPTHTYAQGGNYTVTLTAVVCSDTSVFVQEVSTWAVGIEASPLPPPKEEEIRVLPNPANEQISISPPSGGWGVQTHTFVLYDVLGKEVARQVLLANGTSVKTQHLPSGIYLYQIINPQNQTLQHGKLSILH